jgi:hypothetical protein
MRMGQVRERMSKVTAARPAADLDPPPEGVVILPEPGGHDRPLDPRAWVEAVRRPAPRRLRRPVAEYLTEARELGEGLTL